MGNWSKVFIVLTILSVGVGFGGYLGYKSYYVKPRADIEKKRVELQQSINNGKQTSELWSRQTSQLQQLYARSFPTDRVKAGIQYQLWLSQMLDFCNARNSQVVVGQYVHPRNSGTAVQKFAVQAEFTLLDLTQFLYEFYWTPFLHRIQTLDIQPQEHSELLKVAMSIEGLTILYKMDPKQPYPLVDKLPRSVTPTKQLASGPFAAYSPLGNKEIFRVVKTGVDATGFAQLTGTPIITDEGGQPSTISRWYFGTEGRSASYRVGDVMTVGAFVATILDIDADSGLVVLKQDTDRLWVVPLGYALSDAVAVPVNLY